MASHLINKDRELTDVINHLSEQDRLAHDTETMGPDDALDISGLYPFHGARSFSHIFATKDDEFYIDFNKGGIDPSKKSLLQPIFSKEERIIFYVNAIFDATISHFDGLKFLNRVVDCPSIARVEYNRHAPNNYATDESFLSLEYLAKYYEVKLKDDRVKKYIKEHDLYNKDKDGKYIKCRMTNKIIPRYQDVPLDLMFEYGCSDARSTFDIGTKIIKCINYKDEIYVNDRMGDAKMIDVAKNEIKLTSALIDMKIEGAKLWTDYVHKAMGHEKEKSRRLHKKIDELTGGINLNSPKQIGDFLVKKGVKLPTKPPTDNDLKMALSWEAKLKDAKTDKVKKDIRAKIENYRAGRLKTDKKTLKSVMKKYPDLDFLSMITDAKEADKKLSTYYGNFLKLRDSNDIIHCGLNQEKAITGRFSSSDPNFQNLHKEKWDGKEDTFLIRRSIIQKSEDYNLFFFDYSGQEMYIMIDLAEDLPVIKDIIENNTDIYLAMGNMVEKITGIVLTRDEDKALSLSVAYGQGKALTAKNLKTTIDKASDFKSGFLKSLKGVARLDRRVKHQAKTTGKIHNPYGRVSYIEEGFEYKALNSLIQGTAADCTKHAIVELHKLLKNYRSHMILTVHDEIIFEIHKDEHELIPKIKVIMSEAYPHKLLRLKVDVEYSERAWGEKKDYHHS